MTLEMLDELRDVRIALEGCVAARATARMDEAQVAEVRALCETMHTHAEAGDTREYLRANFAFHRAIYRHGASESTLAIIENLWMRIGPFLNMVAPDIPHMRRSMVAHRAIVEAIARGDGAGAKAGIALDIDGAAHDLATTLGTARDAEDGAPNTRTRKQRHDSNRRAPEPRTGGTATPQHGKRGPPRCACKHNSQ